MLGRCSFLAKRQETNQRSVPRRSPLDLPYFTPFYLRMNGVEVLHKLNETPEGETTFGLCIVFWFMVAFQLRANVCFCLLLCCLFGILIMTS